MVQNVLKNSLYLYLYAYVCEREDTGTTGTVLKILQMRLAGRSTEPGSYY